MTGSARVEASGARSKRAEEDVQTTREEMQTSQEELKSTNEELQSTNEELQSTNEELTTSKEEMQSLNEELQTVNHELQSKVDELSRSNNDMKNLLNSTDIATLFLDDELHVRRFTTHDDEAHQAHPGRRRAADHRHRCRTWTILSCRKTRTRCCARSCSGRREVATRDGRWFLVRIMPYRTLENVIDGVVITFTDASASQALEAAVTEEAAVLEKMAEALPCLVWGSRSDGYCDYISPQWVEYTGVPATEHFGYGWIDRVHPDERDKVREEWRQCVLTGSVFDNEFRLRSRTGAHRSFKTRQAPIHDSHGQSSSGTGRASTSKSSNAGVFPCEKSNCAACEVGTGSTKHPHRTSLSRIPRRWGRPGTREAFARGTTMGRSRHRPAAKAALRSRAEQLLKKCAVNAPSDATDIGDSTRALFELKVHHIELEIQNDELRATRNEAEDALRRYTDLFDLPPSATRPSRATDSLSSINHQGARLLRGDGRAALVGRRFDQFVRREHHPEFASLFELSWRAGIPDECCEVELYAPGYRRFRSRLSTSNPSRTACHAASDVSGHLGAARKGAAPRGRRGRAARREPAKRRVSLGALPRAPKPAYPDPQRSLRALRGRRRQR